MSKILTLNLLHAHPGKLVNDRLLVRTNRSIFGGGVCLTADVNVVLRALGEKGTTVHLVEVQGPAELELNLDIAFDYQSAKIREAILLARRWLGFKEPVHRLRPTSEFLLSSQNPPRSSPSAEIMEAHSCLAHHGIWLVHTNRVGLGQPGRPDELHNYCVLSQSHVILQASYSRTEPDLSDKLHRVMGPFRSNRIRYLSESMVAAA